MMYIILKSKCQTPVSYTHLEIFYLTPNSVTKIRVYIYIEGQDVDNYDICLLYTSQLLYR